MVSSLQDNLAIKPDGLKYLLVKFARNSHELMI